MDNGKLTIEERRGWLNRRVRSALLSWGLALLLSSAVFFSLVKANAADVIAPATAKLSGRITLAGSFTQPKPLPVFKNRDFCGSQVMNETLLVGRDGGLKNAVVILRPLDRGVIAKARQITLDNRRCAFVPHVQVAPVGSELLLKNSDSILHTVHARLGRETLFNVGLPSWRTVNKRLDRGGVVKIDCDVLHTWMSAAIVITDSRYYAISDSDGGFSIEGLSAGTYDMEVWHEGLGTRRVRIHVLGAGDLTADVVFSAAKIN